MLSVMNAPHLITGILATGLFAGTALAQEPVSDTFTTPEGKTLSVTCLKHATLLLEYDGLAIHVDPVGKGIPPETDYARQPKADVILVTHEHFDHFDSAAIAAIVRKDTALYANPAVCAKLGSGTALRPGDTAALPGGISLAAVPAYNTTPDHLSFHPKGRDNGYILTLGGLRLYIAGDTEDIPEMSDLRDIDIAFLPCNQPYTMTPAQAARAAHTIHPKVLFPYHCSRSDAALLADALEDSGIDVRLRVGR